jgi:uncharacterized protein YigE (DUF2233 family)
VRARSISLDSVCFGGGNEAGILETHTSSPKGRTRIVATQSGPTLVIEGAIHPAFVVVFNRSQAAEWRRRFELDEVHFVITQAWVNSDEFARFFRDGLGCDDALFLDGA